MRRRTKRICPGAGRLEKLWDLATEQLVSGRFQDVVATCRKLLQKLPPISSRRAEALVCMGTAYAMSSQFEDAYRTLTEALELNPRDAVAWYNRGLSCRYVMRSGQSVRDLERAVALEKDPNLRAKYAKELRWSQGLADSHRRLRGPCFTVDDLIEQEELFQRTIEIMERKEWKEAEDGWRRVIAMGDGLPQPWGNLGVCLLFQRRRDEAQAALERALEVDPEYDLARRHLDALAHAAPGADLRFGGATRAFEGRQVKRSLSLFRK